MGDLEEDRVEEVGKEPAKVELQRPLEPSTNAPFLIAAQGETQN